jgi:hypothetical protein
MESIIALMNVLKMTSNPKPSTYDLEIEFYIVELKLYSFRTNPIGTCTLKLLKALILLK